MSMQWGEIEKDRGVTRKMSGIRFKVPDLI